MAKEQLETIDTALLSQATGGFDMSSLSGIMQKIQPIVGKIMPIAQKFMGMFQSGGTGGAAAGGSQ